MGRPTQSPFEWEPEATMNFPRPSTLLLVIVLFFTAAGVTHYRNTRRIHEFRGTLFHRPVCVPENPRGEALLQTPEAVFELSFAKKPELREQLPGLEGKHVRVRGTLRITPREQRYRRDRTRYWIDCLRLLLGQPVNVRRCIRVVDLQVEDASTTAPLIGTGGRVRPLSLTKTPPIPNLSCTR
jgi:hypothetical protein